jgi:hypothetical protein
MIMKLKNQRPRPKGAVEPVKKHMNRDQLGNDDINVKTVLN